MGPDDIKMAIKGFKPSDVVTRPPVTENQIRDCELRLNKQIPRQLRELYQVSNGIELRNPEALLSIIDIEQLIYQNTEHNLLAEMPNMLLFGFDAGALYLFTDPQNALRKGCEAIFAGPMSAGALEFASYLADDLVDFIVRFRTDVAIYDRPFLKESDPQLFE